MAANLYVAKDGTIHKNPITVVNNTMNTNNGATNNLHTNIGVQDRSLYQITEGRSILFWFFSMIVATLIGWQSYQYFGAQIFGDDGGFFATIGPYAMVIGAVIGSFLYGKYLADKLDYNLWTYLLSVLFSVVGIVASVISVFVISLIVMILLLILGAIAVFGIIIAISGDS